MADLLLSWFAVYGTPLLVAALVFGQTGIPVPTSILLLTVGALLSDSAYSPAAVFVSGLVGAIIGDQIGYWIGRLGGEKVVNRIRNSRYSHMVEKAERFSTRWGATSVFFTRWLVSPVGPYLNYLVGMTKLSWPRFTAMSVAGEALWIAMFLTIGHQFRQSIAETDDLLANLTWFAGATIAAVVLGRRFRRVWIQVTARRRARRAERTGN